MCTFAFEIHGANSGGVEQKRTQSSPAELAVATMQYFTLRVRIAVQNLVHNSSANAEKGQNLSPSCAVKMYVNIAKRKV